MTASTSSRQGPPAGGHRRHERHLGMSRDRDHMLLVACRHRLRPISLIAQIDDRERAALRDPLRGCVTTETVELDRGTDELLQHFRITVSGHRTRA